MCVCVCVELFNINMQQIALKSNKLSIYWQPLIAVNSRCQGVDRSPAQVRAFPWNNNGRSTMTSQ